MTPTRIAAIALALLLALAALPGCRTAEAGAFFGGGFFPEGDGGAPAAVEWVDISYADVLTTVDTGTWLTGAVTEAGGVWSVPLQTSSNTQVINGSLRFHLALPAGLGDGSDKMMLTRVLFDSVPANNYGANVGWVDPVASVGISSGLRQRTTFPAPEVCGWSNSDIGTALSGLTSARGVVTGEGDWDGVNSIIYSAMSTGVVGGSVTTAGFASGTVTPNKTNARLLVHIIHGDVTNDTETISFTPQYALVDWPI